MSRLHPQLVDAVASSRTAPTVEDALRQSEARHRALIEGIPQLVWRACDGGRWTWSSPQWTAYTGQSDHDSHDWGWLAPLHPDDREAARTAWRRAVETGGFEVEYRVLDVTAQRYRWFQTRATAVRNEDGQIIEWLGTSTDIDDLRRLQQQQQAMIAELQHRTRNLIAVVRAIAQQTMAETDPTERFREQFNHRLAALSRVQGLLSRAELEPVTVGALVRQELEALGLSKRRSTVRVEGPEVALRNSSVQVLTLAIHELAANALAAGALATEEGELSVRWDVRGIDERRLHLEWVESGLLTDRVGDEPSGYGRELIEQALPYALGAETRYERSETALRCIIDLPLDRREETL